MSEMDKSDIDKILETRYDNGADFWATPDGRLGIDKPISTLTALLIMSELKVERSHEALQGATELLFHAIRDDGRVRISPKGSIYPCHTAIAAAALCRNGYADDIRVKLMLDYLLAHRFEDGGWRCNKFLFGRGPETNFSNPGVTLFALDAFRCTQSHQSLDLDRAVETLLDHWTVRVPTGPCHFGMGSLFMQVEYPFLRYNLFYYVYVLSFYAKARKDYRFIEAYAALHKKLDHNNNLIVERPNRKLNKLEICREGEPSEAGTKRYFEIVENMQKAQGDSSLSQLLP